jgi:hypothetical protein
MTATVGPNTEPVTANAITANAMHRVALTSTDRDELFALLSEHFDGVLPDQFQRDLDEKDWVLRIRSGPPASSRLIGFTTLQASTALHERRTIRVLYSGDTIMAPEGWGSPVLAKAWIALVHRMQAEHPHDPWYWLLLSSGFRTYRFLPVFWRDFWPRFDQDTPVGMHTLLTTLAQHRFGAQFDAQRGVVRFDRPQRLRGELAEVPAGRATDPHIRYFLACNPGHADGDELVCLAPINDDNLSTAGVRVVRSVRRG